MFTSESLLDVLRELYKTKWRRDHLAMPLLRAFHRHLFEPTLTEEFSTEQTQEQWTLIIILFKRAGVHDKEMAAVMGVSELTVDSWLHENDMPYVRAQPYMIDWLVECLSEKLILA